MLAQMMGSVLWCPLMGRFLGMKSCSELSNAFEELCMLFMNYNRVYINFKNDSKNMQEAGLSGYTQPLVFVGILQLSGCPPQQSWEMPL